MAYNSKSYRKFLATGATAALVATAIAPAASAAAHTFKDVNSNYEEAVSYLFNNNITKGYSETMYGTTMKLTRGNAAVIIANALKLDTDKATDAGFTDVNSRVEGAVNALVEAKILDGMTPTTFGPDKNLTRGQMAKILVNAYKLQDQAATTPFTDLNSTFAEYIKAIYGAGITGGKTPTTFGTNLEITRGEFANLLYKSIKFEDVTPDVSSVSSATSTSYVVNFKDAVKDGVDASKLKLMTTVELDNGTKVTPTATKVTLSTDRKTATVEHTGNDLNNLKGKILVNGVSADFDYTAAKVSSVSAINAKEVLVKTNKTLSLESANDEANYSVFINGNATSDVIADAQLQADGKSVLVRFTNPLVNGQTVNIATKASLLTSDYKSVPAFTGETVVFNDTTAPKLVGTSYNGTNVVATFDEPVSSAANIRVNGVTATLGAATATTAGNYEYILSGAGSTPGDYTVVLSDVKDSNNNNAGTLTGSYKVVADATTPTVSKVEASGQNSFKITFSKPVASFASIANNLVVKKGAGTIAVGRLTPVLSTDQKSVTVTIAAADAQLPLYATGETSVGLSVSFNNYKDANGLLGAPYSGTVTLSKDAVAPTILSKNLVKIDATRTIITVKYNEAVDAQDALKTGIVIKKDGIVQSTLPKPTVANDGTDLEGKTVTFTFGTALTDANYTFDLPKGIVQDKSLNDSAADSFSLTVSSSAVYIQPTVTAPTDNTNQIKLAFGTTDMTDSATTLANYKLDDAALPSGTTINFVDDKKNVLITLPANYPVVADAKYKLSITNVKAVDGSTVATAAGTTYTNQVTLKDNVAPELKEVKFVKDAGDATKFKSVQLTFSENLAALGDTLATQADFKVLVNGSAVAVKAVTDGTGGDKVVTLTIGDGIELFNISQATTVTLVPEGADNTAIDVKDIGLNKVKAGVTLSAIQ